MMIPAHFQGVTLFNANTTMARAQHNQTGSCSTSSPIEEQANVMDVKLTNLQQLCDPSILTWPNSQRNVSKPL